MEAGFVIMRLRMRVNARSNLQIILYGISISSVGSVNTIEFIIGRLKSKLLQLILVISDTSFLKESMTMWVGEIRSVPKRATPCI